MPIAINGDNLKDDNSLQTQRYRRNGITSIVLTRPVAILQARNKLKKQGFFLFPIDVSYERLSKNRI